VDLTAILLSREHGYVYLIAAGFALSRILGVMAVLPAFTRLGVTGVVRNGIALAVSIPLVPAIVATLGTEPLTVGKIAAVSFKEMAVGVVVGLILGVPFWAAEAAGDILDIQRGASLTTLLDPNAATETSVTGTVFTLAMTALYYASGGLFMTLHALYESYGIWPIGRFIPLFGPDSGRLFLALLDEVMTMGLMLVGPIVVCLFLADILLALVSRAAPHFNIFALSLAVKNLIFAVLLVLYSGFLASYMRQDLATLLGAEAWLRTLGNVPHP
jgi:type III secretion protein T